jgi:hypothetical protein
VARVAVEQVRGDAGLDVDRGERVRGDAVQLAGDSQPFLFGAALGFLFACALRQFEAVEQQPYVGAMVAKGHRPRAPRQRQSRAGCRQRRDPPPVFTNSLKPFQNCFRERGFPVDVGCHALALGPLLVGLGTLGAGCGGGSRAHSVARLAATSPRNSSSPGTSSTVPAAEAPLVWAQCMTSHGVAASPGPHGRGFVITGNADPNSPRFRAAWRDCRRLMPSGGPPALSPAERAERAKGLAVFAACMRSHGLSSFPDPNGQGEFPLASIGRLDTQSAFFQGAYQACQELLPKIGPRIGFGP